MESHIKYCEKHKEYFILLGNRLRCRSCQLTAQRKHYITHHEIELSKRKKQLEILSERNKQVIRNAKNVPCTDCGQTYPFYIMQFDHLKEKLFNVSQMLGRSTQGILDEIAKCEVVCANCHAERTWQRKNQASLV